MTEAKADLIFFGGRVRTPAHPSGFAPALAIRDGLVIATGDDADVRALAGPATRQVDLAGRLALPTFGDSHIHAISGGLESLRCNLLGLKTRQECLDKIAAYSAGLAPGAWVLGGGWSMEAFPGGTPTAADLDAVTGGRPAFLPNRDHHGAWVNSEALRRGGITKDTPDPLDGRIERYEDGQPTGTLHDGAMAYVARHVPAATPAELRAGLAAALDYLHSLGIAYYQDACIGSAGELGIYDTFDTYAAAAGDGTLTASVTGALWWNRHGDFGQADALLARRERAALLAQAEARSGTRGGARAEARGGIRGKAEGGPGRFRATSVKLMVDGVCETFTAAMSQPYLDRDGHPTHHHGNFFLDPEELTAIARLIAGEHGFQLHFHALGDAAVTAALDAIEALPGHARAAGRHHLAHLQFIKPSDVARFAALGAVANFQPLWACAEPQMEELTIPFVGPERARWQYQIGGVAQAGGRLAFGSDWPVSSADPIQEIHVAVNRAMSPVIGRAGTPEVDSPFLPEHAISLDAAIAAFTSGVAYVNHEDDVTGVLTPGMRADVAVLDQDLYAIPASEIGSASVVMTVSNGQVVFGDA
ncbi:MAG TPA: amidohydrolase [Trebonia sp.]|nr:amidohydrolase [Trebonia sp.]